MPHQVLPHVEEISLQVSDDSFGFGAKSSEGSKSSEESQVEFADVVEKLSFAIENVRQLKPWKDRALKAERSNRQLNGTVARLKNELSDTKYELQKWKKRALRAEQENQDEVLKWKKQAIQARSGADSRDEIDDVDLLMVNSNTFTTNLASERDDDDTTISTFRDDSKSIQNVTGKSFRDKWNNFVIEDVKEVKEAQTEQTAVHQPDENSTVAAQELIHKYERDIFGTGVPDESSTVAAEEIMQDYERGHFSRPESQQSRPKSHRSRPNSEQDDGSTVAAEEILNNYLNMKV